MAGGVHTRQEQMGIREDLELHPKEGVEQKHVLVNNDGVGPCANTNFSDL